MFRKRAFKDDQQRALVCKTLCDLAAMPGMWTAEYGPTETARNLFARKGAGLTAGQDAQFLAAWVIWDGSRYERAAGPLSLDDVLTFLEGKYLKPLATLLVAIADGPQEVDRWLVKYDRGMLPTL